MNLYDAEKILSEAGIDDAEFECRLLAERFFHIPMSRSAYMKTGQLDSMPDFGEFVRIGEESNPLSTPVYHRRVGVLRTEDESERKLPYPPSRY